MRRTLALAGAAVVAIGLTGLAGPPAAADSDTGVMQQSGVIISEVAAELGSTSGFPGGYIELKNANTPGGATVSISGWEVFSCNTTSTFDLTIGQNVELAPGQTYLISDAAFASTTVEPDDAYEPGELLELAGSGVELSDSSFVRQDDVMFGDPHTTCSMFNEALDINDNPVAPSNVKSINYDELNDRWSLDGPTPQSLN